MKPSEIMFNLLETTPHYERFSPPGTPALLSSPTGIQCSDAPECGNRLTMDAPPQFTLPPCEFCVDGLLAESEFVNGIAASETVPLLAQL
jgi:hypothetical protein